MASFDEFMEPGRGVFDETPQDPNVLLDYLRCPRPQEALARHAACLFATRGKYAWPDQQAHAAYRALAQIVDKKNQLNPTDEEMALGKRANELLGLINNRAEELETDAREAKPPRIDKEKEEAARRAEKHGRLQKQLDDAQSPAVITDEELPAVMHQLEAYTGGNEEEIERILSDNGQGTLDCARRKAIETFKHSEGARPDYTVMPNDLKEGRVKDPLAKPRP